MVSRRAKRERARERQWARQHQTWSHRGWDEPEPGGLEYLADDEPAGAPHSSRGKGSRGHSGIWDHQARSPYEDELDRALARIGVTGYERNARLGPWELDFLWRREKLVVEVDGFTHLSRERRELDRRKEESLRARGYRLLRFQNREVRAHPQACARKIQKALRRW